MPDQADTIALATELTIAWLSNPNTRVTATEVPAVLASMYAAVGGLDKPASAPDDAAVDEGTHEPAVSARKSLASPEHIISMIDGKPYRSLARHLRANGLTPDEYRRRYNLKSDYPMVAPAYSEARRATALRLGLGRKAGQTVARAASDVVEPVKAAAKRVRKGVVEAKKAAQAHLGGE